MVAAIPLSEKKRPNCRISNAMYGIKFIEAEYLEAKIIVKNVSKHFASTFGNI
jgi:hypothetical protein